MDIQSVEMNYKGLISDNGYSYPSVQMLKNIFASSCVEAVARKMQVSTTEAYKRMKSVEFTFGDMYIVDELIREIQD